MTYPIPVEAFDDRLATFGTAGAGKTYMTIGAMARLLKRSSRLIGVDPLGVMWGLRLMPDGVTPSPFKVVIFGGPHGDLPLNEHAGALIGETAATMAESCILDLSELGTKASERRFMLAFLTALYRHANKEPVHLIFDEADMWAPQKLLDKDGDAAKLLGMMETVVRRGRVRGFVPWLITQRPAVLSKDVSSLADGVVAMKLTSKQDRDAFEGWIEGQADRAAGKDILSALPTLQRGTGYVWLPARGILKMATFPENQTFDSSRTPKRGEKVSKVALKPLDLQKLQGRLAAVVEEQKANDPKALRAEIARLKVEISKTPKPVAALPQREDTRKMKSTITAYRKALEDVMKVIVNIIASDFFKDGGEAVNKQAIEDALKAATDRAAKMLGDKLDVRAREATKLKEQAEKILESVKALLADDTLTVDLTVSPQPAFKVADVGRHPTPVQRRVTNGSDASLPPGERAVMIAAAQFGGVEREQLTVLTGYKRSSRDAYIQRLREKGFVEVSGSTVVLTQTGADALPADYEPLPTGAGLQGYWLGRLPEGERKILQELIAAYPNSVERTDLELATGYKRSSRDAYLQRMKAKRLWEADGSAVRASAIMFG